MRINKEIMVTAFVAVIIIIGCSNCLSKKQVEENAKTEIASKTENIKYIDKEALIEFLGKHEQCTGKELVDLIEKNQDALEAFVEIEDVDEDTLFEYGMEFIKTVNEEAQPEIDPYDSI